MERITVTLGERSYPITIAAGLFNDPASFLPLKAGDQAMLVTNETLAPLYLDRVRHLLEQAGVKVDSVILPDGEQYKSLTVLDTVFTALLQKPHGKSHAVFDFSAIKKFIPMAAGRGRPAEKLYRSPKPDVQRAVAVRKAACGNQTGGRFGRARSLRLAQHIVQPEGREQKPCKPRLHYTRPAAV